MRENSAARFYELMVITTPEGTPEELVGVVDQVTGYIESAGGTILRANYDSPWGRRRLSYPIRHESQDVRDGFYTLVHLEIEPDKVATVERDLKLNTRLMRYLVLQLASEPVFPEPAEEETEGEQAPAESGEGATPAATTTVDEPTAAPVEAAEAEDTAEERRTVVASAEADSGEATAEGETETSVEAPEAAAESGAEITEVETEAADGSIEEKE
jgi:small subunit ribosomal protein S6